MFKIRCSAIGKIMTSSRSKSDDLSQTAKTYCEEWLKSELYGRKKEIISKYMDKGLIMEDESIDFVANYLKLGMLIKNEQYFQNDFMTGTPDLILPDMVIDIKNSWDCFTFPIFQNEINQDYYWQLQGYMILTGKTKSKLIYTLMDTPEHLIERDWISFCYHTGQDKDDLKDYQEFEKNRQYSKITDELRIKIYDIDLISDSEKMIKDKVGLCRDYIKTLNKLKKC